MSKKVFIILASLVAIVAAWLVIFPGRNPLTVLKAKTTDPAQKPSTATPGIVQNGAFAPNDPAQGQPAGFPIYPDVHTSRKDIAGIQMAMNDFFGSNLVVDGYFGPKTLAALKAYGFAANDFITYDEYTLILDLGL